MDEMNPRQFDERLLVIHFCVPQMIKQKAGKIIPSARLPGSAANRFTPITGLQGRDHQLREGALTELARHNILVNCVAPLGSHGHVQRGNQLESRRQGHRRLDSLGRAALPKRSPDPFPVLASDLANFMTGEIINVNGGAILCG